ncbi:hypothetical protein BKA69DRAFT_853032 [Paraphysoderma sedebokerense]|nr:hypothetical protein BKA69DRAFT_853032 [Paraphysoderma sedebokerense]
MSLNHLEIIQFLVFRINEKFKPSSKKSNSSTKAAANRNTPNTKNILKSSTPARPGVIKHNLAESVSIDLSDRSSESSNSTYMNPSSPSSTSISTSFLSETASSTDIIAQAAHKRLLDKRLIKALDNSSTTLSTTSISANDTGVIDDIPDAANRLTYKSAKDETELHTRVAQLEAENAKLKSEYSTMKSLYECIISDPQYSAVSPNVSNSLLSAFPSSDPSATTSNESTGRFTDINLLNHRRFVLMKSQIWQLERHINAKSALATGQTGLIEELNESTQTLMAMLTEYFASSPSYCKASSSSDEKLLKVIYKMLETMNQSIQHRYIDKLSEFENLEKENLFTFVNEDWGSIKQGGGQMNHKPGRRTLTLADICSGEIKHLNLRHISRLESQLCQLHALLLRYKSSVETFRVSPFIHPDSNANSSSASFSPPLCENIDSTIRKFQNELMNHLENCIHSTMSLSSLVPTSPVPDLNDLPAPNIELPTSDELIDMLLGGANVSASVRRSLKANTIKFLKTLRIYLQSHSNKLETSQTELKYYKTVFKDQETHMEILINELMTKAKNLERQGEDMKLPLQLLLDNFAELKLNYSNTGALEMLKKVETVLSTLLKRMSDALEPSGASFETIVRSRELCDNQVRGEGSEESEVSNSDLINGERMVGTEDESWVN